MYQLTPTGSSILRLSDNAYIPPDPANTDYAAYLDWLVEGNVPLEFDQQLAAEEPVVTWDDVRAKRDQLIRESDWTMIPDASVNQGAWAQYRQVLRDLPQTYEATGPESVIWPTAPSTSGPNTIEG